MARICKSAFGLGALLLVVLAAGCGGGSKTADTSTAQGTTASTATATTPNKGFTQAQWKQYQTDAATFKTQNTATIAKVKTCVHAPNHSSKAVQACVGDSLTALSTATKALGATLAGLANSVGGACQTALGQLINYVVPYEASIAAVQQTIDTGSSASIPNAVSSIQVTRSAGQAASANVEKTCAP